MKSNSKGATSRTQDSMSDKRQKSQLVLAFTEPGLVHRAMVLRNPLNRPMRTRMSGGVAGAAGRPLPYANF